MFTLPDDPYAALGVSHKAQIPEIRSAHRKLVLKCHPDKVADPALKAAKQEEFQKVQKAYELLSDERERQKYDDMRQANELEKENAERRRQRDRDRDREFTPGRTPPRYDSEFARNPHYKTEPSYKIRTAEPPPGYTKSAAPFAPPHSGSKSPYVGIRTPPRSFEDNIHHSSFDDVPTRRSKKTSVVYGERISSRHDDERRSRKKDEDSWERLPEKPTRRKDLERKEQDTKDQERKERKKEEKRKAAEKEKEKSRDQERRKEIDEKRNPRHKTAYVEEVEDYITQNVSPGKPEKKSKPGGRVKETVPKEQPLDREHKQNSNLEFAAKYLARSKGSPALNRAQTYHYVRHVSPPPATPTPPPAAAGAGAFFDEDEPVRRSSARRRMSHETPRSKDKSSAHKKSSFSREPEYVDEPMRHIPSLKKASTMPSPHLGTPPSVPESPPRFTRAQTDHYSRPVPGPIPPMTRATTWRGDGGDARDRSRSQHAHSYSDQESEEELRPRRSRHARSPDDALHSGNKVRYTVLNGRTVPYRDESPVGRRAKHGYYEANMGRPMEHRPTMASYGSYGSQVFEKVKTAKAYNPDDVVYANIPHAAYRGAGVYTT